MAEINLPSKKDLEKLYKEKGHDALVWYAWRNALRALPILGKNDIQALWRDNAVKHVMSVCRVSLVLAQWHKWHSQSVTSVSVILAAATYAAQDARVAKAAYAPSCAIAAADAAIADYHLLHQQDRWTAAEWISQPLWGNEGEPAKITQYRHALDQQLRDLQLDFLADDLHAVWEGKPLGEHAKYYLEPFSEVELNDPIALRRLIVEGEAAERIHSVRVLLLGPGGAGKSSLADRLQGKPVQSSKKATLGIDYLDFQPLNLYEIFDYLAQGNKPLELYLWDFGGQSIFHGLHSAFLHENCVYVLVVDSRHEQAPDEWLHQIKHLTDGKAKVLLVTNWYEGCETRQNEKRLIREFPDLLDDGSFFSLAMMRMRMIYVAL